MKVPFLEYVWKQDHSTIIGETKYESTDSQEKETLLITICVPNVYFVNSSLEAKFS